MHGYKVGASGVGDYNMSAALWLTWNSHMFMGGTISTDGIVDFLLSNFCSSSFNLCKIYYIGAVKV